MRNFNQTLGLENAWRLFEAGDYGQAESLCREVLKANRQDLKAIRLLGLVAFGRGDLAGAASFLNKCLAAKPSASLIYCDLARVRLLQGKADEAITCYNKALKHKPGYELAVAGKAGLLERMGDRENARALLHEFESDGGGNEEMAVVLMKLMEHDAQLSQAIDVGESHRAKPVTDKVQRIELLRQLGRLYDRTGDYKRAFETFTEANQSGRPFNPEQYVATVDQLIETFSATQMRELPHAQNTSELPVFIACMPRSGSTLVDQIIHAHPQAFGAGEITHLNDMAVMLRDRLGTFEPYPEAAAHLTQDAVNAMSREYLEAIMKMNRKAARITNKHLHNYKHLGMVSLLFPRARVVHTHRDPLDNCLGVYMAALEPSRYPWVGNQEHLALVWKQYQRLMKHWRETLDIQMLDVRYEDLVDDPDGNIRRIIEFCGLPWDDKCLKYYEVDRTVLTLSYDQVRRPIYKTAVRRFDRYREFFKPLEAALSEDSNSA